MCHHGIPEDAATQRAVLGLVLAEHPAVLAASEIEREVGSGDPTFRALRDLIGVGLLRREGALILPTRAALYFNWLDSE
jgi:hypothetical protein